jgi:hypothetical protein
MVNTVPEICWRGTNGSDSTGFPRERLKTTSLTIKEVTSHSSRDRKKENIRDLHVSM